MDGEQMKWVVADVSRELLERCEIVQNPDRSSVCSHDQIVFLWVNVNVINSGIGQTQPQQIPMRSLVPGDISPIFESGVVQVGVMAVLTDDVSANVLRQITCDRRPTAAVIGGAIEIGFEVAQVMSIDGDHRLPWIVRRNINAFDSTPFG